MIRYLLPLTFVALAMLLTPVDAAAADTPRHPDDLDLPPLLLTAPSPVDTFLSNGLRVLVFPNHDVPIVTVTAMISMGSHYLSLPEIPAYNLLSRAWAEGGAGQLSPDEFDIAVATHGVSLTAHAGLLEASVSAYMTVSDLAVSLPLWRDLLLKPGLDAGRLERAKSQWIKDLQAINDNPRRLTQTWFNRLLHGPESLQGVVYAPATIAAVNREDLLDLHRRYVVPQHTVIGVAGDLTIACALDYLEDLLGDWSSDQETPELQPHARQTVSTPGVFWLPMDLQQCHVRIGRLVDDLTMTSPEYPHAHLLSYGLGFLRVYYTTRERGLSYGAATILDIGMSGATFSGFGSTSCGNLGPLLDVFQTEIDRLVEEPLTAAEVSASQVFLASSAIARLETPSDVLRFYLSDIARRLPAGFSYDLAARYHGVQANDLVELAVKWLNFGDRPVVLVIGQPEGGMQALMDLELGPVTVLEPVQFGH